MQSLAGTTQQTTNQELKQNPEHIDKGLLPLSGRPLVAWQQAILQPWVQQIIVNTNRNAGQYAPFGQVLADDADLPADQGPLIGLLTLLRHSPTPWVVVVPVDSPFLPDDFVLRLLQAQQEQSGYAAYYCRAERDYPLCLLMHTQIQDDLAQYIASGQRRVVPWLQGIPARAIEFGAEATPWFTNINTPDDLQAAAQRLG